MAALYQTKSIAPGEVLLRAEELPVEQVAFLVLEGMLEVYLDDLAGKPVVLGYVKPGQIVGEMALIDGGPRSAHVRACSDQPVKLAIITQAVIQHLLTEADPIVRALLKAYNRRLRAANGQATAQLAATRTSPSGPLLLAVAADAENLKLITQAGAALHVNVITETSGLKALNSVQAGLKPSIIVAAARSLDIDGGLLSKMMALRSPKARLPFLLLDDPSQKQLTFNTKDVDGLLDHPYKLDQLVAALKQRLKVL